MRKLGSREVRAVQLITDGARIQTQISQTLKPELPTHPPTFLAENSTPIRSSLDLLGQGEFPTNPFLLVCLWAPFQWTSRSKTTYTPPRELSSPEYYCAIPPECRPVGEGFYSGTSDWSSDRLHQNRGCIHQCPARRCTVPFRLKWKAASAVFFVHKFSHVGCNLTVLAEEPAASGIVAWWTDGCPFCSTTVIWPQIRRWHTFTDTFFSPKDRLAGSSAKCHICFSDPRHHTFPRHGAPESLTWGYLGGRVLWDLFF